MLLLLAARVSSAMASMDELEASVLGAVVAFVAVVVGVVGRVRCECVCNELWVHQCVCVFAWVYVCVHVYVNRLNKSLNYSCVANYVDSLSGFSPTTVFSTAKQSQHAN